MVVEQAAEDVRNEVVLTGRLSVDPVSRELPSGDAITTFRVVVRRGEATRSDRARAGVDALDCVAWTGRVRRTVQGWAAGDVVEVHGSLRRRFYRVGSGAQSRVEVEVTRARRVRRPTSG